MEPDHETHKKAVDFFLDNNLLISSSLLPNLSAIFSHQERFQKLQTLQTQKDSSPLVVTNEATSLFDGGTVDINWIEFEHLRALEETGKDPIGYRRFFEYILKTKYTSEQKVMKETEETTAKKGVTIRMTYGEQTKKVSVPDFLAHFTARYNTLQKYLEVRRELQRPLSISRLTQKKDKENVMFIGLVHDKQTTQGGNILLTMEDPTGMIKAVVHKDNRQIIALAQELVLDEMVGVVGTFNGSMVYVSSLILPDVPLDKEFKKAPDEVYAAFVADLHVGAKAFLKSEFLKFIQWINGQTGSETQRDLARKVRYLFIVGDLVEGVGIYPGQDKDLEIPDIKAQYNEFTQLVKQLPSSLEIVLCPGNHDAVRLAEPQPQIPREYIEELYALPNVHLVSNPALVRIHASEEFPGFDVLMYHGYSFPYYASNVDSIRLQGGQDRTDLIMKFLLQRRHLAPSHTSTLYLPTYQSDPLVIDTVPDFFITGHLHRSSAHIYRNVTMLACSCWIPQTPFQEKLGINPQPCRLIVTNLQTRQVKVLKFGE
ncbi:metallophosphoesterase [Candidatus Woesearchaeota archaeon]|nr:metallophosphoesterase [Candidatus Woesearchaeota archaeon]